jgi:AraC-like DNA-binding protein
MLAGQNATWVVYHPRQGQLAFSPHQIEAVLAAVVAFGVWLTGAKLRPLRVQFSQSRLGPESGYREVFACPVDFEQAFNGLLLSNVVLEQALPQANAELAQVHEQFIAARLAVLDPGTVAAEDLRRWLLARMGPQVPRRAQAALALGVSERTLARRLSEQGHSFDSLLDDVRRELALIAVADIRRPLSEIAQSLGFAEPSPFYRAFRRWTGTAPVRWRRQIQTEPSDAEI